MPNDMSDVLMPAEAWDFNGHRLDVFWDKGERWIRVAQIARPLEMANESSVRSIIDRNPSDFGPARVHKIRVPTPGGPQWVLAVSPMGALRLCMLGGTPPCVAMRDWLEQVVQGLAPIPTGFAARKLPGKPEVAPIVSADGVPPELESFARQQANATYRAVVAAGAAVMPFVPRIRAAYARKAALQREIGAIDRELHEIYEEARGKGVRKDSIKQALNPPVLLTAFALDGEGNGNG